MGSTGQASVTRGGGKGEGEVYAHKVGIGEKTVLHAEEVASAYCLRELLIFTRMKMGKGELNKEGGMERETSPIM